MMCPQSKRPSPLTRYVGKEENEHASKKVTFSIMYPSLLFFFAICPPFPPLPPRLGSLQSVFFPLLSPTPQDPFPPPLPTNLPLLGATRESDAAVFRAATFQIPGSLSSSSSPSHAHTQDTTTMTPETVMTRSGDGGLGWSEGKTTLQFWGIEREGWRESLIIVVVGGGDRGGGGDRRRREATFISFYCPERGGGENWAKPTAGSKKGSPVSLTRSTRGEWSQ